MVAQAFLILCGSILLVQTVSAQCVGYAAGGLANNLARADIAAAELAGARLAGTELAGTRLAGTGYGLGVPGAFVPAPTFATTNGGSFTVTSSSPIVPIGINVFSENTIEGPMEVAGNLPVLATVNVEGKFPSNGAAGTSYGCGNGQVGISNESLAAAGLGNGLATANLARAELASAAAAGLAGNLARAEIVGSELAAPNRLARPCGTI